jgi:hypothetical protein
VSSAEYFLALNFVKICLPKANGATQIKVKVMVALPSAKRAHNVLNLSDKVKF